VDEGLFEALRRHRLRLARDQGLPPYVVAGDRTLREIAAARPASLHELSALYGIGPAKLERYGQDWLDLVARTTARPTTTS
jgi:ATP-dependent DNA helicase RecQ